MNTESYFGDGLFDFISSDLPDKEYYKNAHWAITECNLWLWLKNYTPDNNKGFVFTDDIEIKIISKKMFEQNIATGHSGASFNITMYKMNYIAKNGYDAFRNMWYNKN